MQRRWLSILPLIALSAGILQAHAFYGLIVGNMNDSSSAALMSATVAVVVGTRAVQELPLNGPNIMNLIALAPGMVPTGQFFETTILERLHSRATAMEARLSGENNGKENNGSDRAQRCRTR